jgi:hypothetical protein
MFVTELVCSGRLHAKMIERIYASYVRKESVPFSENFFATDQIFSSTRGELRIDLVAQPEAQWQAYVPAKLLASGQGRVFIAGAKREPKQSRRQVGEIDVRQLAIRSFRHGIQIPHQRE